MGGVDITKLEGEFFDVILKRNGRNEGIVGIKRNKLAERLPGWLTNYSEVLVMPESPEVGEVIKYQLKGTA